MVRGSTFDIIIIGGGHAGCEAYAASTRLGQKTALIVPSIEVLGLQPCNPAVGGPGKGHLVREIVAMGGLMGKVTDKSGIQFRTLNAAKGPAVRSTRVQTESAHYITTMKDTLLRLEGNGLIIEDFAMELLYKKAGSKREITGVVLEKHGQLSCKALVVTTGTYLRGKLFVGDEISEGGRVGGRASVEFARSLEQTGLPLIRLKTGTCPRLDGSTIDYDVLEAQKGDDPPPFFCPDTIDYFLPQKKCHLTYTNEKTHEVINKNLKKSALFSGNVQGIGPRYCPSVETKIHRFPEKEKHQIFLEPEDRASKTIYPSGLSTSLPKDVQLEMVHSIKGLEKARIVKWGYAVDYDAVDPRCLLPNLEVENFSGLFLAGQILGTSGYEEAGALGLLAGANAALKNKTEDPIVLARNQAYAGVMIDDLTGVGVDEPYRMFTSRAEYRLLLREDNADERLLEQAQRTGLISKQEILRVKTSVEKIAQAKDRLLNTILTPSNETNLKLVEKGLEKIAKPTSLLGLARRENNQLEKVFAFAPWLSDLDHKTLTRIEVDIKYEGYLGRQEAMAKRLAEVDSVNIPRDMNYDKIPGLRNEIIEKLKSSRPVSLGQASRIPGMTPAGVDILSVYIQRHKGKK